MKSTSVAILAFLLVGSMAFDMSSFLETASSKLNAAPIDGFRAPAVPLIVFDPFMSIWSMGDNLYDSWPQLWCGRNKAIGGAIRIDGKTYRYMGPGGDSGIPTDDVITQKSVVVLPTQTVYTFETAEVSLEVKFSTPTIPTDLQLLSQPVTYISFVVSSLDGAQHDVELYYDQTAEIAINDAAENVTWSRPTTTPNGPQIVMKLGSAEQKILGKAGDCDAINWGYAYLALSPVDANDQVSTVFAGAATTRAGFVANGTLPADDDTRQPRAASDDWPLMAVSWKLQVSAGNSASRNLTFAYDDLFSVDYFGTRLQPYWRRDGSTADDMLVNATRDYAVRLQTCDQYDQELLTNLTTTGGAKYATVSALVFRQTLGGCKLVWNQEKNLPWYFMKEISSNGDFHTVDVIFPAAPLFLYVNPYLMELMMLPLFGYASNETNIPYNLAWAPHHLGTYPIANCRPEDQEQMPVEESGNLLMIIAALVKLGNDQGRDYHTLMFPQYTALVQSWADYLLAGNGVLPDPEDQLCTDDFLGPSPHSANLALKGIVALGCYAKLSTIMGQSAAANRYMADAKAFADYWMTNANDTDHYRMEYDLPNTWSLKYNLLFQYILDIEIFPQEVIEKELNYLMANDLNKYGIPLNNKIKFSKLDWLSWMAAMAPKEEDRQTLFDAIYNFANETPDRVPLTDWYETDTGRHTGFQARTVLGAFYGYMLIAKPENTKQNLISF